MCKINELTYNITDRNLQGHGQLIPTGDAKEREARYLSSCNAFSRVSGDDRSFIH